MRYLSATVAWVFGLAVVSVRLGTFPAHAEEHRATRLGSPATRFTAPLASPDDLRARFRDETLRADIASILRQWGWGGDLEDLRRAAITEEIAEVAIPVGTRLPFMSSRHGGRPVCLRNVLWAGREPIAAYAFRFYSHGRLYRCVTPKACGNFFLEDLGAPALTLDCECPEREWLGRPVQVRLTLQNLGSATETQVAVLLAVPEGNQCTEATEGCTSNGDKLAWKTLNLTPGTSRTFEAIFRSSQPGSMDFAATARGEHSPTAECSCETRIQGVPAILLEVVDLEDPIEVGHEVTYEIRVTNQGSAPGTNLRLSCTLPASQGFVAASGPTAPSARGQGITLDPLPSLAPKAVASWRVQVKAASPDDARFRVELRSDQFEQPIRENESTRQY